MIHSFETLLPGVLSPSGMFTETGLLMTVPILFVVNLNGTTMIGNVAPGAIGNRALFIKVNCIVPPPIVTDQSRLANCINRR